MPVTKLDHHQLAIRAFGLAGIVMACVQQRMISSGLPSSSVQSPTSDLADTPRRTSATLAPIAHCERATHPAASESTMHVLCG